LTLAKNKNDSYEVLLNTVQRAAWRNFDNYDDPDNAFDSRVLHTFSDAVILMNTCNEKLYEASYLISDSQVVFSSLREVEEQYVAKRAKIAGIEINLSAAKAFKGVEIGGPIVIKNAVKRIAHAAVLVPGEPDSDGEIVTSEKIEEVAHGWMESYRNVDLMHTLNNVGVPVESYITSSPMEVEIYGEKTLLPKGTWVLASKFSEETWNGVEDGTFRGYSVMGVRKSAFESAAKSKDNDIAYKRTLLQDLGPDWVATHVSIVDEPAVPKAKFFSIKSADKSAEDKKETEADNDNSLFAKVSKFMDAIGILKKSKKEEDIDMSDKSNAKKEIDLDVLAETIANSVKTAVEPLSERVATIEESLTSVKSQIESINEEAKKSKDVDSTNDSTDDSKDEEVKKSQADSTDDSNVDSKEVNDDKVFKEAIMERLDSLEKLYGKKSVSSKGLKLVEAENGNKNTEDKYSIKNYRDHFGRRRKKVAN
jgi:hypothetical protein